MMRKSLRLIMSGSALALFAYLIFSALQFGTPVAAAGKPYVSTLYLPGNGGHFARAEVTIDPQNEDEPIRIEKLDRMAIGTAKSHLTHDPRMDMSDRNTLFWATYGLDPEGKMHVGKLDLRTGKVLKDLALVPDKRSPGPPPMYCASGQTKDHYLPVFMGTEGYVDVFDKKTLEHRHRVFVSGLGYKVGTYNVMHGTNSPDLKKFLVTINLAEAGKANGKIDFLLVDLPSLERGEWKVLAKNTLAGEAGKTINFRQYFTRDGKYIYQAVGDRVWVLETATLTLVDEKRIDGQIHDAMPTPDGKYALLTIRNATQALDGEGKPIPGKNVTDGTIKLYDFDKKRITGRGVSTCQACHKGIGLGNTNAIFCGIDGNWKN